MNIGLDGLNEYLATELKLIRKQRLEQLAGLTQTEETE